MMKMTVVRYQWYWDVDLFGIGVVVIKLNVVEMKDEARSTRTTVVYTLRSVFFYYHCISSRKYGAVLSVLV